MRKKKRKPLRRKIVLRLPDLDHAKNSVLNSLNSPNSRRNYRFSMEQFITWYCSEPRLALNRAVVLRFRLHLESLGLAAGTTNQRLAAVRRLAYEAADSGLLSPELAAGIRRVKGSLPGPRDRHRPRLTTLGRQSGLRQRICRRRAGVPSESPGLVGNGLLATLQELEHLGVGFVSLTEALGPITPAGRAMAGLLFAELEREILLESAL